MFPGKNGCDDVIIVFDCIRDLHSSSGRRLSGGADVASLPAAIPLTRNSDRGILAAPLLMTACLVEVVEHFRLVDVASTHTWGFWRESRNIGRVLGETWDSLTASLLTHTSEVFDNR